MSQLEVDKIIPQSGTTLTIGDSGDTVNFADGTSIGIDTNTLYIDSTNNRVGIGTSSPSTKLHLASGSSGASPATGTHFFLESSGDTQLCISSPNANTSNIRFGSPSDASGAIISYDDTNNTLSLGGSSTNAFLRFVTGGASVERMRIDSSGNLLVGKSSLDYTTAGTIIRSDGALFSTTNGANTAVFERLTSDGDIIRFEKDNTTVGKIFSRSGVVSGIILDPRAGGNGLLGQTGSIIPVDETQTREDNATDLGNSTYRWKDLYLGGGLYVGGTGTANKLDDYEEGTFSAGNPTGSTGGTITFSSGFDTLSYIKIGSWCYVMGNVQIGSISGTLSGNYITFNSLPFTIASLTDGSENGGNAGTVDSFGNSNGTVPMAVSWGGGGTNNFYVYRYTSDGNLITGATVGTGFRFAFGYRTA
jgi:hypothetical protein